MFKRKVVCAITLLFLVLGNLVCYPNKVFAYSTTPTHPNLTKEMIRLYNLYYDPDITGEAYNRIVQGSIDEDMAPRWSFHLYDPVYNRAPFEVATAKQWAIEDIQGDAIHKFANALFNIFGSTKFSYHGDFSWNKNIKNFVGNKTNEAWYGLGHILHLIADMTVPAHSRNDHHIQGDPFESWTGANLKVSDYNFADKIYDNNPYGPFDVTFISEAFDDLARYSNRYFFSKDSLPGMHLGDQYSNPKIIDTEEYDYGKYLTRFYAMGRDENNELIKLAQINTLKRKWLDATPGNKTKNDNVYIIDDKDYNIHLDYWQRLAPKAVEYGMAVIRLFVENAEYEKEKLAKQQNPLNMAQVVDINNSNVQETNNNIVLIEKLPKDINPGGLPQIQSVIIKPIEIPLENPKEVSLESPKKDNQGDNKGEQGDNNKKQGENKGNQDQSIIVVGPTTGGGGGVNPSSVKQEELPLQENQNNVPPESEPEPQTEPETEVQPETETQPHLLINEIQIRDDEFIELYNPTSSSIDLSGYYFSYFSSNNDWNNPHRNQEFPASASIDTNGYYLIGLKGYSTTEGNPNADWQPYDSNQLGNAHGSVVIFPFDPKTKTANEAQLGVIDVAAWASASFAKEGIEFQQSLSKDKSMQRINFQDTNNNSIDFEYKTIPSPTNSHGQTRTKGTLIKDNIIIDEDTTWTIAGSPYYLDSNSNQWPIVEQGATLTIEPGVVIMPRSNLHTSLEIRGTLNAEGTTNEKIIFTSDKDNDYGGSGGAIAGDWLNILFGSTSNNSVLKNVIFRYGGAAIEPHKMHNEMIKIDSSSVLIENIIMENGETGCLHLIDSNSNILGSTFKDCKTGIVIEGVLNDSIIHNSFFENNSEFGLQIINGAIADISDNQFINNGQSGASSVFYFLYPSAIGIYSAYPQFNNNDFDNNFLNGVLVSDFSFFDKDFIWNNDVVYFLMSNAGQFATVEENATIIIESGTIIKTIGLYTSLLVKGTLRAEANSGDRIVFTSLYDDSLGGDSNNDSNVTVPAKNDWKNIKFETTSTDSVFDNVLIYYGTGEPPFELIGSASVEIKTVDYTP